MRAIARMLCRVAHDPFGQTSGSEGEVIDAALRDQSDIVVRMIARSAPLPRN